MIKILIVDDEKTTREGLQKYIPWKELRIERVLVSSGGYDAVQLAQAEGVDIVLCDIRMPKMDGIELCERIRKLLPRCKIVFLSAFADKENLKNAIKLNAVRFLEKPIQREQIKSAMGELVSQIILERNEEAQISESIRYCKQMLAYELTGGSDMESIRKKAEFTGLAFMSASFFVTWIVALKHTGELDAPLKDGLLSEIAACIEGSVEGCIGCYYNESNFVFHIFTREARSPDVHKGLPQELKKAAEGLLGGPAEVFIGAGQCVRSVSEISESYKTAVIALQRLFFIGYGSVECYREYMGQPYEVTDEDCGRFEQLLKSGAGQELAEYLNAVKASCVRHKNTIADNVRRFYLRFLQIAHKHLSTSNLEISVESFREENLRQIVWDCAVLEELHQYTLSVVEAIIAASDVKTAVGNLVLEIIKYINMNYHDKNLSIKGIANHIFVTPTYICYIFKHKMGKTVNQYITEIRMEKAKELLQNRQVKLYEISSRLGYVSTNHFAKIFKKHVGINPSQYRERYAK